MKIERKIRMAQMGAFLARGGIVNREYIRSRYAISRATVTRDLRDLERALPVSRDERTGEVRWVE